MLKNVNKYIFKYSLVSCVFARFIHVYYTSATYFACFINTFSTILIKLVSLKKEQNELPNVPNLIYLGGTYSSKVRKIQFFNYCCTKCLIKIARCCVGYLIKIRHRMQQKTDDSNYHYKS